MNMSVADEVVARIDRTELVEFALAVCNIDSAPAPLKPKLLNIFTTGFVGRDSKRERSACCPIGSM